MTEQTSTLIAGGASSVPADLAERAERAEPIACEIQHLEATAVLQIAGKVAQIHEIFRYCRDEGGFDGYMKKRLGYSHTTAYRYLHVHMRFGKNLYQHWYTLPTSAIYLLAEPSTPEEALNEITGRIEAGDKLTVAEVQKIITRAKKAHPVIEETPENENLLISGPAQSSASTTVQPAGNGVDPTATGAAMGLRLAALNEDGKSDDASPPLIPFESGELATAVDPYERYRGPDGHIDRDLEHFDKQIRAGCFGAVECATSLKPPLSLAQKAEMRAEQVEKIDEAITALLTLRAKIADEPKDDYLEEEKRRHRRKRAKTTVADLKHQIRSFCDISCRSIGANEIGYEIPLALAQQPEIAAELIEELTKAYAHPIALMANITAVVNGTAPTPPKSGKKAKKAKAETALTAAPTIDPDTGQAKAKANGHCRLADAKAALQALSKKWNRCETSAELVALLDPVRIAGAAGHYGEIDYVTVVDKAKAKLAQLQTTEKAMGSKPAGFDKNADFQENYSQMLKVS